MVSGRGGGRRREQARLRRQFMADQRAGGADQGEQRRRVERDDPAGTCAAQLLRRLEQIQRRERDEGRPPVHWLSVTAVEQLAAGLEDGAVRLCDHLEAAGEVRKATWRPWFAGDVLQCDLCRITSSAVAQTGAEFGVDCGGCGVEVEPAELVVSLFPCGPVALYTAACRACEQSPRAVG